MVAKQEKPERFKVLQAEFGGLFLKAGEARAIERLIAFPHFLGEGLGARRNRVPGGAGAREQFGGLSGVVGGAELDHPARVRGTPAVEFRELSSL